MRTDRQKDGSGDDNTLGALRGPRVKIGKYLYLSTKLACRDVDMIAAI